MPIFPPQPEPVPFEEVAAVLASAASRVWGGPPAIIEVSARHLATALHPAGMQVVRVPEDSGQLTL